MYIIVYKQVKKLISQYVCTCKSVYTKGYAINRVLTNAMEIIDKQYLLCYRTFLYNCQTNTKSIIYSKNSKK